MLPQIRFIKNMTHEAAGLFSMIADSLRVPYSIADIYQGEPFPVLTPGDALVILGGPDSANDTSEKILREIDAIRSCMAKKTPTLGICLGLQLLVKACGGIVDRSPVKEIGFRGPEEDWFEVELTEEGTKDPIFDEVSKRIKVFQLHGETVHLTPEMSLLARGKYCGNQVVKITDRVYGIQGHVELNEAMFRDWMVRDPDLKKLDAAKLGNDFQKIRSELEKSSLKIFTNFLKIAGFIR